MEDAYDVDSYALSGKLDWKANKLVAVETVRLHWQKSNLDLIPLDSAVTKLLSIREKDGAALQPTLDRDNSVIELATASLSPAARAARTVQLEIAYEANANLDQDRESAALRMVGARRGDPVPARVAYTSSEPQGAEDWMPCHDIPSDRATFSIELELDPAETLIANGELVRDELRAGRRILKYETRHPLPPYLMAFAAGDLVNVNRIDGKLPLSVWTRRGVPVEAQDLLTETARQISVFESLLTPFPFEKYALVMVPDFFAGGVENASVSFVGETRANEPMLDGDRELAAHELAHQWFGDMVTVKSWDDLWIKEGMATLLQEESRRPWEDRSGSGRLFGRSFFVENGMAIRDTDQSPDEKYHSGVYGRGAWLFTQLRARAGEQKFWATLRQLLQAYAYGSLDTDTVLSAFSGVVDGPTLDRAHRAVSAHQMPLLSWKDGTLRLEDPDQAMVVPVTVLWHLTSGEVHTGILDVGSPLPLPLAALDLLIVDPKDVHPIPSFRTDEGYRKSLLPRQVPRRSETLRLLMAAGAAPELAALHQLEGWTFGPADFPGIYEQLASEKAKLHALDVACFRAEKNPAAWRPMLTRVLSVVPYLGLTDRVPHVGISRCRTVLPVEPLNGKLRGLANDPQAGGMSIADIAWLGAHAVKPSLALDSWGALAKSGASVRERRLGLVQLIKHLSGVGGYEKPMGDELDRWKEFLRGQLTDNRAERLLEVTLEAVVAAEDDDALPLLADLVSDDDVVDVHHGAFCAAYSITKDEPKAWKQFLKDLGKTEELPPEIRALVKRPEKCDEVHADLGDDD